MVLTLIAEVLSGETMISPGGAVDMVTATGLEAFTWDRWLDEQRGTDEETLPAVEIDGVAIAAREAINLS